MDARNVFLMETKNYRNVVRALAKDKRVSYRTIWQYEEGLRGMLSMAYFTGLISTTQFSAWRQYVYKEFRRLENNYC